MPLIQYHRVYLHMSRATSRGWNRADELETKAYPMGSGSQFHTMTPAILPNRPPCPQHQRIQIQERDRNVRVSVNERIQRT